MPLYEYTCQGCDHRFEVLVRTGETPTCPSCRSSELEKTFSTFAVGAARTGAAPADLPSPCASCHDPRGPGACKMMS